MQFQLHHFYTTLQMSLEKSQRGLARSFFFFSVSGKLMFRLAQPPLDSFVSQLYVISKESCSYKNIESLCFLNLNQLSLSSNQEKMTLFILITHKGMQTFLFSIHRRLWQFHFYITHSSVHILSLLILHSQSGTNLIYCLNLTNVGKMGRACHCLT